MALLHYSGVHGATLHGMDMLHEHVRVDLKGQSWASRHTPKAEVDVLVALAEDQKVGHTQWASHSNKVLDGVGSV